MLFKKNPNKKLQALEVAHNRALVKKQRLEEKTNRPENHEDAFVCFRNVQKVYPNGVHSVIDFNLDIKQGEFIVFVGPSGCGKTTTLRMVCGLEDISAGALYIDGVYSNDLPPSERGISMVFQNYALFPHLTVYENMAYGLLIKKVKAPVLDENGNQKVGIDAEKIKFLEKEKEWLIKNQPENTKELENLEKDLEKYRTTEVPLFTKRKLTKEEIKEKINRAASILNLTELLERKPGQLSGGQCQRVALGRVIVSDAKLLLMDEPLSNLDAKLRVSMRGEISKLHKKLGATTIYVTHDQVEAMTMSDRIVVMSKAEIKQIGTPEEVYNHPNCLFVATFIGSPTMNILPAKLIDGNIQVADSSFKGLEGLETALSKFYSDELVYAKKVLEDLPNRYDGELLGIEEDKARKTIERLQNVLENKDFDLSFGIRPEDISLAESEDKDTIIGTIDSYELLGQEYHVSVELVSGVTTLLTLPASFDKAIVGEKLLLKLNLEKSHLFDTITGKAIY